MDPSTIRHLQCKDHKLPVTCLAVSQDCQLLFTASKDCTIVKWSMSEWKRLGVIKRIGKKSAPGVKGHKSVVQSLSISSDGKFLASGDMDNLIHIWDPATMNWLHTFKGTISVYYFTLNIFIFYMVGHRSGISGLVFRRNTHTLYSSSLDRTVKIWNLDETSYVETL